jgi:hypothetical protein
MKKITIKKDQSKPPTTKSKKDDFLDLINKELTTFNKTGTQLKEKSVDSKPLIDNKIKMGKLTLNQTALKNKNDDLFNKSGNKFGVKIDMKHLADLGKVSETNNSQLNDTHDFKNTSKIRAYTTDKTFKKDGRPGSGIMQQEIITDLDKNVNIF